MVFTVHLNKLFIRIEPNNTARFILFSTFTASNFPRYLTNYERNPSEYPPRASTITLIYIHYILIVLLIPVWTSWYFFFFQ